MKGTAGPNGVLVIDKPSGITSHQAVRTVGRVLGTRQVGHCGTLDPDATGVLVVCAGHATRWVSWLTASDKTYEGELQWGTETETGDASGRVVHAAKPDWLPETGALRSWVQALHGWSWQVPPVWSAIRVDGERSHVRARRGESVAMSPRMIHVGALEITIPDAAGRSRYAMTVSRGTYVRSLIQDAGRALGGAAHTVSLRRTRSGPFGAWDAVPWDLLTGPEGGIHLAAALLPPAAALQMLPLLVLGDAEVSSLRQGRAVPLPVWPPGLPAGEPLRALLPSGALVGVVRLEPSRAAGGAVVRSMRLIPES
jgi:tRNA pseudouridine55 synthase